MLVRIPDGYTVSNREEVFRMGWLLLVLLLALVLGGLGFAVHVLWWIALIVLAVWVIGFFLSRSGNNRL